MKRRNNIWGIALIGAMALMTFVLFGCDRTKKDSEFIGPAFIAVPEGFNVTGFSGAPDPVDFTTDSVVFSATFSHNVSWILKIVGQESGAVREFRGLSSALNLSNANWKGRHDGITFFRQGETATATLSFYGTGETYTDDIVISVARDYSSYGTFLVAGDFETPAAVVFPDWVSFGTPGAEQGVGTAEQTYNGKTVTAIQGTNYYYIRGLGNQAQFVDGIRYDGPLMPAISSNPDSVWVNIYIYGTGDPNAQVNFEFKEEDFDGGTAGYQDAEDDAMVATVFPEHTGWKLYSFKYSNLTPGLAALFGGSGNKIHEPDRVQAVQVGALKRTDPDSPIEIYFDYPIITYGGPFDPSK